MSANVWSEEVERGLKQEILNTVFYLTDTGIKAPLTEDMVFVRDPEEDLREEQIPCVTITPLYNRFDARRYNPNPVIMSRNDEENLLTMQDSAVPFNLFYQIDFWSRYKEDINLMTSTWLRKHFRQFNLKVVDDGGTERSSNVIVNESLRESDLLKTHSAVPFNLFYQIDFWSRYKEDINLMTSTWLRKHFRQFNLKVVDDGGTERSSNVIVNESLRESDLLKNQKRLFHSIISYVIWVELDDEVGYNVHMVAERNLSAEQKEGGNT